MHFLIGLRNEISALTDKSIASLVPSLVPKPNLGLRNFLGVCKVLILQCAPVAQLDRAFDYESKGRVFESRRAHHKSFILLWLPAFVISWSLRINALGVIWG
jgi:hypothetical protein